MNKHKKVLISGRQLLYVKSILDYTDWVIELIVLDDFIVSEELKKCDRIHNIMSFSDVINDSSYSEIDFNTLQQYMYVFQVADYGARRLNDDFNFSHYDFLRAIAFWNNYFINNHIDLCIISNHYHGYSCDYIVQEVAKMHGIPCYNVFYHNTGILALYNANNDTLIKINSYTKESFECAVHDAATYTDRLDLDSYFVIDRGMFARITCALGGVSLYRKCSLLKNRQGYVGYKKFTYKSYKSCIKNYRKTLANNKKLYKSVDDNEKYVIYFLHLEPEAVIPSMANTIVSQLFFIDMLSKSLPEGWVLYVKEHPDCYRLNCGAFDEIQGAAATYITPYFYEKIAGMERVKLVDYKIPAGELIAKCQAMSTIAGTVVFEGMKNKKPIILFANNRAVYKLCKDFMFPQSLKELRSMMISIQQGFAPDYSDCEEIGRQYLISDNDSGREAVIRTIASIISDGDTENDK